MSALVTHIPARALRMRITVIAREGAASLSWESGPDHTQTAWIRLTDAELADVLAGDLNDAVLWIRGVAFIGARKPAALRAALEAAASTAVAA